MIIIKEKGEQKIMICDIAYSELNFILSKMSEELKRKIPIMLDFSPISTKQE